MPEDGDEWCMCGERMDLHTGWEGHSPVSQSDWYNEQVRTELDELYRA